jgi:hypothetical protein
VLLTVRVEACLALLSRYKKEGFIPHYYLLQKWILFDNRKRSGSWLDPGAGPKQCSKQKIILKKLWLLFGGLEPVWFVTVSYQT